MDESVDLVERQRLYERTREDLAVLGRSNAESYDRALLTLSSAFLGGSLAFIDQIVSVETADLRWVLYGAWLCFVLTIVLTLGSFVYSLLTLETLRQAAKKYYLDLDNDAWDVSRAIQKRVLTFVVACGVLFASGIALLAGFVVINLTKESTMPQQKLEKSVPPATFQIPAVPSQPVTTPQTPAQPSQSHTPQKAPQKQ